MSSKTNQGRSRLGPALQNVYYPVLSIVVSLVLGAFIITAMGCNPASAYASLLSGALGSLGAIGETLIKATPLVFSALSFAIARRTGLTNLGAEGQLFIGALFATWAGTRFAGLPAVVHLPLTLLAGMLGGALWGIIAAFMKVRYDADELITTMMLNYVAYAIVSYFVAGPLKDVDSVNNIPQSALIVGGSTLPRILPGTRLHAGIFLAAIALVFFCVFLWKTPQGYAMRVVGMNRSAAEYAGINTQKNALLAMGLAGCFAGLAGCIEIIGVQMRLTADFAVNMGFDGVAVALVGNNSPLGIAFSSIFFGMLKSGSNKMQLIANVPSAAIYMIQGLIILFVVGYRLFQRRGKARR